MSSQIAEMMPQIFMLAGVAGVALILVILAVLAVAGAPRARMKKRIAAVVGTGPSFASEGKS